VKNYEVSTGQELKNYMQPLPMRGTGLHRCVYVLCEHKSPIDFELTQSAQNSATLEQRDFNCKQFFNKYKQQITPVGLRFFQTEWDLSVKNYFHHTLSISTIDIYYSKIIFLI
jgi:large subunit ribosomal protein L38